MTAWAWTPPEWARIEHLAREEREYRALIKSHVANGIGGLRLDTARRTANNASMGLRGMAHIASSPFSDDLIRDFRRMHSAATAAHRSEPE